MFDKILFNRNAFDRSVSSNNLYATILSRGGISTGINMRTPLSSNPFVGNGRLSVGLVMQQNVGLKIIGTGTMKDAELILRHAFGMKFSGSGSISPNFNIRTPMTISIGGNSGLTVDNKFYLLCRMTSNIGGAGLFEAPIIFRTAFTGGITGAGEFSDDKLYFKLPLSIRTSGSGDISLRRLGDLNENVLELLNITLAPGEIVVIDTDLLQVLFGNKEDVSSVTAESVFFELNPGENEIRISTDTDEALDVTAIWENRWL